MAVGENNNELRLEDVCDVLEENGLQPEDFPFLIPNAERYACLLMQPQAEISDTNTGVFNRDTQGAVAKHQAFHALAAATNADLVVAPEYSCPWVALDQSIAQGRIPVNGKLWIIGCEAISRANLDARKANAPANIKWIYEDLDNLDWSAGKTFLDPVCMLFRARSAETGNPVVVVLVQFKTAPMGGVVFEANLLACGRTFYVIRRPGDSVKLLCLICSDVLSFPNAAWNRVRALLAGLSSLFVIHVQLNAQPRHAMYRAYRADVLQRQENRELLCLNWARNVTLFSQGQGPQAWNNDSASALYSRRWHTHTLDEHRLELTEQRGLYFCYAHDLRSMVAFLNFRENCYHLLLSKANQNLANPEQRIPQTPEVVNVWYWSAGPGNWMLAVQPIDSEAAQAIATAGINIGEVTPIVSSPLRFERFSAISIGNMPLKDSVAFTEWPEFKSVDAHRLDPGESILRTSFAQDMCPTSQQARTHAYMRLAMFLGARRNPANFPRWMVGFRTHTLTYEPRAPYSNLRDQQARPGTAVFMPTADLVAANTLHTRIDKHIRSLGQNALKCDPLYVVIWIPFVDATGATTPRVYPDMKPPRQDDDPNAGQNEIDSEVG